MEHGSVIASIERAGDHAVVLGVVLVLAVVAALVYRVTARGRAGRARSDRDRERTRGPKA